MEHAGANINLTISSCSLALTVLETGHVVAKHEMPRISFASGGDTVNTFDLEKQRKWHRSCISIFQWLTGNIRFRCVRGEKRSGMEGVLRAGMRWWVSARRHLHHRASFWASVQGVSYQTLFTVSCFLAIETLSIALLIWFWICARHLSSFSSTTSVKDADRDYYNDLPGKVPPDIGPPPVPPLPSTDSNHEHKSDHEHVSLASNSIPNLSLLEPTSGARRKQTQQWPG